MAEKLTKAKEFMQEYEKLKEGERHDITRVVNKLLQVNFITCQKASDKNDYLFILENKEAISALLALLDFSLEIKREAETLYIVNTSGYNRLRLKKNDTVVLLILRILFQRALETATISQDIEIELKQVHDELARIGFLDKRISKKELRPVLQTFKSYNLIDFKDPDLPDSSTIRIYKSILYVINIQELKNLTMALDEHTGNVNEEVN